MLTKHKPLDVKGPLKNVFMSVTYSEFFSVREHQIFTYFQAYFFWKNYFEAYREKRAVGGPGACSPENFFNIYLLQWPF